MNRLKVFGQFNDVEAFFSLKPEKTETLIPAIAGKLPAGEYFIKPWMVHGDHIQVIDAAFINGPHPDVQGYPELADAERYFEVEDTDGLVTDLPGVAMVTTHGDCIPVYAYDPVMKVAGVAHAGWKGTRLGIAGKLISVMISDFGCRPGNISAFIGPGIDRCCFEVTEEVYIKFRDTAPWMSEFISAKDETHWLIDLKEINRRFIELQGVADIEVCPDCTCCLEDKYWSNRRSKDTGRMLAYIKLK